jgi:hypothetical protein
MLLFEALQRYINIPINIDCITNDTKQHNIDITINGYTVAEKILPSYANINRELNSIINIINYYLIKKFITTDEILADFTTKYGQRLKWSEIKLYRDLYKGFPIYKEYWMRNFLSDDFNFLIDKLIDYFDNINPIIEKLLGEKNE